MIIVTMLVSGALAGLAAVNSVMGSTHYLSLNFPAGAGFVGIAIALMGRQHPVGIFLSSVLFGALIQGGFDLSLEKPNIPQETFIFIQGLIILFCGAMENFYAPAVLKLINLRKGKLMMEDLHLASIVVSTIRNAPVLMFAAMAGLFAERSGVVDIGLEGKILASAFVSAAVAYTTQNPWYGIAAGIAVSVALAMVQAFVAITQKGNQLVAASPSTSP
jgi:ABC-type uncharacterized transport system permease subunit